jgi:hypothetical protein
MLVEVAVEQLVDGGSRARALLDVDEAPADGVSLIPCLRPRRDHLDEVVPLLGDRVGTGVDAHAKGAAG